MEFWGGCGVMKGEFLLSSQDSGLFFRGDTHKLLLRIKTEIFTPDSYFQDSFMEVLLVALRSRYQHY